MIQINHKNITKEELKAMFLSSKTKVDLAKKLGFNYHNGKVTKIILKLAQKYNCSMDHFNASAPPVASICNS